MDQLGVFLITFRQRAKHAAAHHFGESHDRIQRRAKFVARLSEECRARFQLILGRVGRLSRFQRCLRSLAQPGFQLSQPVRGVHINWDRTLLLPRFPDTQRCNDRSRCEQDESRSSITCGQDRCVMHMQPAPVRSGEHRDEQAENRKCSDLDRQSDPA